MQRDRPGEELARLRAENASLREQQAAAARERARLLDESRALQGVAAALASERDAAGLLDGIVERARAVLGADGCFIWLYDADGRWRIVAARGLSDRYLTWLAASPADRLNAHRRDPAEVRRTAFVPDLQAAVRPLNPSLADAYQAEGLVSALRLPLFASGDRMDGGLVIYHRRQRPYADDEIALAQAFADQAALAIEQARLLDEARSARAVATERAVELAALLDVAAALTSTLEVGPLLGVLLDQLRRVTDYTGSSVVIVDGDDLVALDDRGGLAPNQPNPDLTGARLPLARAGPLWAILSRGDPVIVGDARGDEPLARAYQAMNVALRDSPAVRYVRSLLAVPLITRGRAIGYVHLSHTEPDRFTRRHAAMASAIANHAAAAIENARLHAESLRLAALEERARLARDLHDSVTQSVFSARMLTHAAIMQHERGAAVGETLGRVRSVLGDALGELRALLYELQPAALADEGLAQALEKLAGAAQVRTDAAVVYQGAAVPRLPPETEAAIFRIVQEALANAIKYARASVIRLTLAQDGRSLVAAVEDDGTGFDPDVPVTPSTDGRRGGMGLRSMRERAALTGLAITIESAPGRGTRVTARTPLTHVGGDP